MGVQDGISLVKSYWPTGQSTDKYYTPVIRAEYLSTNPKVTLVSNYSFI